MDNNLLMNILGVVILLAGVWVLRFFFPNSGEFDHEKTLAMLKDSKIDFNKKVFLYLKKIKHGEESGYIGSYQVANNRYVLSFNIPLSYFHGKGSLSNDFEKKIEVKLSDLLKFFHYIKKDGDEVRNHLYFDDEVKKQLLIL